jgi:alpha-glucosidase (family GH31 glycosyl hydrolase)
VRITASAVASVGAIASVAHLAGATPKPVERQTDQQISLGGLTLVVRANPWQLSLLDPNGQTLWDEDLNQTLGFTTADGQLFRAQRLASFSQLSADAVRLIAATDDPAGGTIGVDVTTVLAGALRMTITPDITPTATAVLGGFTSPADERLVGFGERFDGVNQRGRRLDTWAQDRRVAGYGASTYAPVPLLLSSRGHGFALERFERSRFDLAAARDDVWSWQQDAPGASVLLTYGPRLKDLVQRNAQIVGTPTLPPAWLFGVWKTSVGGQDAVIAEMHKLRDLNIPVSAVFSFDAVDSDANIGWPDVTFAGRHPGPYTESRAYTDTLHGLGYKVLNYFTADFHTDRPNYQEPAAHGFLIHRQDGRVYIHPDFNVAWLDFTDPDASVWWSESWRRALSELGYDGGMLDLGELIPADASFADGTSGKETHNRYPLLYAASARNAALAARPSGDFALLLRSAALGAQRFQSAQWDGDAVMRWEGPDGLQSMIPAALSFGLSGFPYWHAEVAGYVQANLSHDQERELWLRWLQLASWTSLLRDHLGDQPHAPIDVWLDDGTVAAFRQAAQVHASLLPYIYSVAAEASRTGVPILRYLPLEVPEDARAWQEEQSYFFGPTFLVAPVVQAGATARSVYLPTGDWVDYWRGTVHTGGQDVTVPAPLDASGPPVFARAGAIIPLAPEYDSLAPADPTSGVRTWAGDLVVRVLPGGSGAASFTLYDGARLDWDGTALRISSNPTPRSVQLRTPDGRSITQRVDGLTATLS